MIEDCSFYGCTATGKSATNGDGGAYVKNAAFNMKSITISECSATNGGAYVYSGTFNMQGGSEISGCSATSGGVYVTDTGILNVTGGVTFSGCTAATGELSAAMKTKFNDMLTDVGRADKIPSRN